MANIETTRSRAARSRRRRVTGEGAIDRLPSGRWRARFAGPDGRRHTKTFMTKADASAWLSSQHTDIRRGTWIDPGGGKESFSEWAKKWLATTAHLKMKTKIGYESLLLTHIEPFFGDWEIITIDQPAVRRFFAHLADGGAAPGTIRSVRNVLRQVLGLAMSARALAFNPCDGVRLPRSPRTEMHFLTAPEVEDLAHAITNPQLRPGGNGAWHHQRTTFPEYGLFVRFTAYTGLRAGEIEALRVRRLDLLRSRVEVAETVAEVPGHGLVFGPPKTYENRSVPVPRFLTEELARAVVGKSPDDFVFAAPEGGPIRHGNFYARHYKRAVRQAGLPEGLRFHDLRHTYASFLIAERAHPRAIMERMGHSSITVTLDRYGHLLPSLEAQLDEALDRAGRSARKTTVESTSKSRRSREGHAEVLHLPSGRGT